MSSKPVGVRMRLAPGDPVVLKIGSSSLIDAQGEVDQAAIDRVIGQVGSLWDAGFPTVLVTSGAVAAGQIHLGGRPGDITGLQVAAAIGQTRLIVRYYQAFVRAGRTVGQVLITRDILAMRSQYLHARDALSRMIEHAIIPIVNENDTVAVEGLKVGDNDRLAAIVSHLINARVLVLLTDTEGIYTSDPHAGPAELLTSVHHADPILEDVAQGASGPMGSGGVATKVAAARMAAWSGIPTVVARSDREKVVELIVGGQEVGTFIQPRSSKLSARKLWLAFGQQSEGTIRVDQGAVQALVGRGSSLLSVGITGVEGTFGEGSPVEIRDGHGLLIAKGVVTIEASRIRDVMGKRSDDSGWDGEVVHRDQLVVLADSD